MSKSVTMVKTPLSTRQQGIALILVLWVITLLTVIVASFAFNSRTEIQAAQQVVSRAELLALADAGIQRGIFEVYRNDPNQPNNGATINADGTTTLSQDKWRADGQPHDFTLNGQTITVTLTSEATKVDLNTYNEPLLKNLFKKIGRLDDEAASTMVDALIDYRDPDDLKRINGAEAADYEAAGRKDKPANYNFRAVAELKQVLGVTPELFEKLEPYVTVYSRQYGVDAKLASRTVLLLIPDITPEQVDAYLVLRQAALDSGQPLPAFTEAGGSGGSSSTGEYAIHSRVTRGKVTVIREALINKTYNAKLPVKYRFIRDGQPLLHQKTNKLQGT